MEKDDKFSFLKEHPKCYKFENNVYQFKEIIDGKEYRGLIGIPKNEKRNFWYKFFIKGDNDTYIRNTPLEDLPGWFYELVIKSSEIITKRDRLRKIVNTTKS